MAIRTLIVDDEDLARERIRTLIDGDRDLVIVEECANGQSAVSSILKHKPDLVFLDVQMPGQDGFEVLRQIGPGSIPALVFVTAYDQYALQAFDFVALDYLLKPFTSTRFAQALNRAKEHIRRSGEHELRQQLDHLLQNVTQSHLSRIVVKEAGRISFVKVDEIRWIEAQGNYVKLYGHRETHLVRRRMKELTEKLDPRKFLRIHRSIIVNLDAVKALEPRLHGEYQLTLHDGTELVSNRSFKRNLEALF